MSDRTYARFQLLDRRASCLFQGGSSDSSAAGLKSAQRCSLMNPLCLKFTRTDCTQPQSELVVGMISEEVRPSARAARIHSLPPRVSSRIADRHYRTQRIWQAADLSPKSNGKVGRRGVLLILRQQKITGKSHRSVPFQNNRRDSGRTEEEGHTANTRYGKTGIDEREDDREGVQRRNKTRQEMYKEERKRRN